MPSELLFLRQLLSPQPAPNYTQVAILVGLLLAAIYRPERIYLRGMFRLSCVLLAASIPVTAIATAVMNSMMSTSTSVVGRNGSPAELMLLSSLLQVVEPVLVGLSLCFGLFSLLPAHGHQDRSGPKQHPLDP
jgi:hypothetical protein